MGSPDTVRFVQNIPKSAEGNKISVFQTSSLQWSGTQYYVAQDRLWITSDKEDSWDFREDLRELKKTVAVEPVHISLTATVDLYALDYCSVPVLVALERGLGSFAPVPMYPIVNFSMYIENSFVRSLVPVLLETRSALKVRLRKELGYQTLDDKSTAAKEYFQKLFLQNPEKERRYRDTYDESSYDSKRQAVPI